MKLRFDRGNGLMSPTIVIKAFQWLLKKDYIINGKDIRFSRIIVKINDE